MGYYGSYARNPEEVQRRNGVKTDFDMAVKRYESIKPLIGKRKAYDIRPIGERDRTHERIVKVSDTEYYLSCGAYGYYEKENPSAKESKEYKDYAKRTKAFTLKREGEIETIIVHNPQYSFSSTSYVCFYDYNLPQGMNLEKYMGVAYIRLDTKEGTKWYRADKQDTTFYRAKGSKFWTPLKVFQEVKHSIDRKLAKDAREKTKDFEEYAKVMVSLVTPKYTWRNGSGLLGRDLANFAKPKDGTIPEHWLTAVETLAHYISYYDYKTQLTMVNEKRLIPWIRKEVYHIAKPFKVEQVPLGERSHDKYKNWV